MGVWRCQPPSTCLPGFRFPTQIREEPIFVCFSGNLSCYYVIIPWSFPISRWPDHGIFSDLNETRFFKMGKMAGQFAFWEDIGQISFIVLVGGISSEKISPPVTQTGIHIIGSPCCHRKFFWDSRYSSRNNPENKPFSSCQDNGHEIIHKNPIW